MINTQHAASTEKVAPSSGIFVALIPWVLFTVVAEQRTLKVASIAALVLAAVIARPGIREGRPKALEIGAVAAFAGFTVIAFLGDPSTAEFVERYARAIAAALLALIAIASLATVPFTEQYAREKVPKAHWSSPRFKAVNRRLTLLWAGVFAAMVPFHIAAGGIDTGPTNIVLNWIAPIGLVLVGVWQTSVISDGEEA
jgi:hypothetical protein